MRKKALNDLEVGDKTFFSKTITEADLFALAGISGDFNPLHVNEAYAKKSKFKTRVAMDS